MKRSSPPEVFLGKGVLKICSKFTEEHPFTPNHISAWVFTCKFAAYFKYKRFIGTAREGYFYINILNY